MLDWVLASLFGFGLGLFVSAGSHDTSPGRIGSLNRPAEAELARMALAVEGVESSHGLNPAMWQPKWRGPQGPMQVTHAAALDVGGGNRFDLSDNRQIGRAYLAAMYGRYGNWADALAAYNWGPGNLDRWIASGRSPEMLASGVRTYLNRVFRDYVGAPSGVRPQLARLPAPEARVEIRDQRLRKVFDQNREAIKQLLAFVGGDGDAAGIRDVMRQVARRPGYQQFQLLQRMTNPARSTDASLNSVARVMIEKLRAENSAIALVDQHRAGTLR